MAPALNCAASKYRKTGTFLPWQGEITKQRKKVSGLFWGFCLFGVCVVFCFTPLGDSRLDVLLSCSFVKKLCPYCQYLLKGRS